MLKPGQCRGHERGVAALELMCVLPFMLVMISGVLELARMIEVKQVLTTAAREGGRQAAAGLITADQAEDVVREYLERAGMPASRAVVTVQNATMAARDPRDATQLDHLRIRVEMPFEDVRIAGLRILSNDETRVRVETTWLSLKDKPYPSPPEPPIE